MANYILWYIVKLYYIVLDCVIFYYFVLYYIMFYFIIVHIYIYIKYITYYGCPVLWPAMMFKITTMES